VHASAIRVGGRARDRFEAKRSRGLEHVPREGGHLGRAPVARVEARLDIARRAQISHRGTPPRETRRWVDLLSGIARDDQRSTWRDRSPDQRELERREILGLVHDHGVVVDRRRRFRLSARQSAAPLDLE